jgi:hypothetical protein
MFQDAGLCPPLIVKIIQKLEENGWPMDDCQCLTSGKLLSFLEELSQ